MKPPSDLPSLLVALAEDFARRIGLEPGDLWAYLYRKEAPPPAVRAALVEAFFPRVSPSDFALPSGTNSATLSTMSATQIDPPRRGRPFAGSHPFVAMLRKRGLTLLEVAAELKCSNASVRSWYADPQGAAFRPIPKAQAEYLAKHYKVPLSAWHRIAE